MIIPFQKFTFRIAVEDYMHLPYYKGSTFRGAFGNIFRKIVCTFKGKDCKECILSSQCVYAYIFETIPPEGTSIMGMQKYEKVPHPFVIEPPEETKQAYEKGEEISFDLVLVGKAIDYQPYFILSFEELGRVGLGRGRGKYALRRVEAAGRTVYAGDSGTISKAPADKIDVPEDIVTTGLEAVPRTSMTLHFTTPLRIIHERHLTSSPEFSILLRSIMRRLQLLHYFHCEMKESGWNHRELIDASRSVTIEENRLHWHDWERYSSRQNTKMKMGGLVGTITYAGPLTPFLPILRAGEIVHAGKGTSLGLGRFTLIRDDDGVDD